MEGTTKWPDLIIYDKIVLTYVNDNAFAKIVVVWDGLEVRNSSELGVGGVPVLVLAAELGQRPEKKTLSVTKNFLF